MFALLLTALSWLPTIRQNPALAWSFRGAGGALLAWTAATFANAHHQERRFAVQLTLRTQHYVQACAHISILLYWGWYWRQVYDSALLIAAQLVFAYSFDALLAWSRRDTYTLGFGPFPIIFSTNLFLWFKPDWFFLQFLLVAVGFSAKELVRWDKDGRQTHIFNPSSFPLALASLILLLTGTTGLTWGPEIATTQFNPPHIFLLIFLVALPGQFLFGVASMTVSAVATLFAFCFVYLHATGTQFFLEQPIPIAIFLGMHLLFTDPSTAPRTELGRLAFGVLYALSVLLLFVVLDDLGMPTFYDKLLPVPVLNLLIRGIDKVARSSLLSRFDPAALGRSLTPHLRNTAYISLWATVFVVMQMVTGTKATLARGDVLLAEGRVDEAITRYREFTETDPTEVVGHTRLGTAFMHAKRFADAVPSLQRSIELQPHNGEAQKDLGVALMQVGRFDDAVMSLRRAVDLQPNNPEVYNALGMALTQAGHIDDAVVSLQRAVSLQPGSSDAQSNLGVVLMKTGRSADAAAAFRVAAELQPDSPEVHNMLGVALLQAGRLENAVSSLQRAVDLKPEYSEGRYNLGNALVAIGHTKAAVDQYRAAIRQRPDSPSALAALAWIEATSDSGLRNPADSVRLASRAADLSGRQNPQILDVLAAANAAAGQFAEAIRTAGDAEALARQSAPDLLEQIEAHLSLYRIGRSLMLSAP
jgi:Flp pilus assembly protein TadD